jgi:prepilin-type N-terminal cleavage/methylation domain-containing protein
MRRHERGLTLIETMVVVALVSIIAGISFPAVTSGLDTLRLRSAGESIVGLFNSALDRAERRQQPVEIVIDRTANSIAVLGSGPGIERLVELPQGVRIIGIAPAFPGEGPLRSFLLLPSGAVPRFSIMLTNARGALRNISIDPITGVARMDIPQQAAFP